MPGLPNVEWILGNSAGPYTSPVDKLLLHTTEGSSIEGAVAAYRANNSWPHVTADARWGRPYRVVQHLDFGVAARSLRNLAGGVQTNTDGVIQFEVVGQAVDPGAIDWVWLAANVFGPAARMMGIPIQSSVTWVAYPASYGLSAPQRLSLAAWTAYQGFLGHQHCPENTHGDPGLVPISSILAAARPLPLPLPDLLLEDDMPYILAGDHVGNYYVDGSGATPIYEQPLIDQLVAQNVPVVNISAASQAQEQLIVNDRRAVIDDAAAQLNAPSDLSAQDLGDGRVRLTWTPVAGAVKYAVRAELDGFAGSVSYVTGLELVSGPWVDAAGKLVTFKISGVDAVGNEGEQATVDYVGPTLPV